MLNRFFLFCALVVLVVIALVLTVFKGPDYGEAHFDRDVLPHLQERCFSCHGPDESMRRADLRLDLKNAAVVPGSVKDSRLVAVIESGHPQGGERWTEDEVRSVKAWIDEGAKYPAHWLYRMDASGSREWPKALTHESDPGNEVAAGQWFDHMYLTFGEGSALSSTRGVFLARYAQEPLAAKALVLDDLLKGPKFGEVMAGVWMNLLGDEAVKTAEDFAPYRLWLVNAFNDDLPMSDIIQSQLSADFAKGSDLVPTGFLRSPKNDSRSGRAALLGRLLFGEEDVATRVLSRQQRKQIGELFSCEGDEARLGDPSLRDPVMRSPNAQNVADLVQLKALFKQLNDEKAAVVAAGVERTGSWLAMSPGFVTVDGGVAVYDFNDESNLLKNASLQALGSAKMAEPRAEQGLSGWGVRVREESPLEVDVPVGTLAGWPWSLSFWAALPKLESEQGGGAQGSRVLLQKGISGGREIRLEAASDGGLVLTFKMGEGEFAARFKTEKALKVAEWQHVALVYEGGLEAEDVKIYVDGLPLKVSYEKGPRCYWPLDQKASQKPWVFGSGGTGFFLDEAQFFVRGLSGLEVAHIYSGRSLNAALADPVKWRLALNEYYLASQDAGMQQWNQKKAGIYQHQQRVEASVPEIPVMRRPSGQTISNPVLVVDPTRYAVPIPTDALKNRLAFSRWLGRGDSVLINRVLTNSLIQAYLGESYLPSAQERDGYQVPERLKTLDQAVRFFEASGWSSKTFCREILLRGKLSGGQ